MASQIIECIPNFSEGRDPEIIRQIGEVIEVVDDVKLLNVDSGKAVNRSVFTFAGEPESVIQAAFNAIQLSVQLIDMREHRGEHPRMGATDVCPLVPVKNITMEEVSVFAHELGKRVGEKLTIPVFMYEKSASAKARENLASIRSGEYEGMEKKLLADEWKPDYGPAVVHPRAGVIAIGARDFLVAYNVNLDTDSVAIAREIAGEIRESGIVETDAEGKKKHIAGQYKGLKAIGWYIEEFDMVQVSMNLTDINTTGLHTAYEACRLSAEKRDVAVIGSEVVGLLPKKALLDAAYFYLGKGEREIEVSEDQLLRLAIDKLGLNSLKRFDIKKHLLESLLAEE